MLVQILDDRFLQPAGAEAVNEPHRALLRRAGSRREISRGDRAPDRRCCPTSSSSLDEHAVARLKLHVHAHRRRLGFRRRAAEHAQLDACARGSACRARPLPLRGRARSRRRLRARAAPSTRDRRRPRLRAGAASAAGAPVLSILAIFVDERVDGGARIAAQPAGIARRRRRAALRAACSASAAACFFRSATTASISARASRSRSSSFSFSRCLKVSSRCRSASSRDTRAAVGLAKRLALALDQPPLVLERAQIGVDLREVLGELRLALREILSRVVDDGGVQPEPAGHFEREAAARRSVLNVIGRLVGIGRKAERRRGHARCRRRVGLQRVVVGRGNHQSRRACGSAR